MVQGLPAKSSKPPLNMKLQYYVVVFSKFSQKITPLTIQVNGRHELVGVLMGSGRQNGKPSIYARVSDKLGWIKKHTKGIMDSKCNVLS